MLLKNETMSIFKNVPEEKERLDWKILQSRWTCLVYHKDFNDRGRDKLDAHRITQQSLDELGIR
jgi:hypothetical protein